MEDRLFLWINRDDAEFQGAAALRPVLDRLAASTLPPITLLGAKGRPIKGYLDPAVLKDLGKKKTSEKYTNPAPALELAVAQLPDRTAISLFVPNSVAPPAEELSQLFRDLIAIVSPTYARLAPLAASRALYDEVYALQRRTFYASGLYWLNFFGPKEEAKQGGAALAQNPFARVERLPQGLLMQVGEGPLDMLTPEGRQRLIQATAAMPPHRPVP